MMHEQSDNLLPRMHQEMQSCFYGKYRGKVLEVGEGHDLGYIRAQVDEVYGNTKDVPWAAPSVPFAGKDHGLVVLPEVDDGVWIEFEAGNISKPIWSGFWWAKGEMPANGAPKVRVFATSAGHKLVLDDKRNEVRLEHGNDQCSIVMTDKSLTLKVGNKKIVIDSKAVTVNDGNLEVT